MPKFVGRQVLDLSKIGDNYESPIGLDLPMSARFTCRIAVVYKTLGPYHVARLAHLAAEARLQGILFEGVALAGKQKAYPWLEVEDSRLDFQSTTLFPGEILEHVSLIKAIRGVVNYLRKTKPNIVFISNYTSMSMALLAIGTRLLGGRAVIISDSTWFDRPRRVIKEKLKRIVLAPYFAAFVAGERSRTYMHHLGIPLDRIVEGCDVVDNHTVARHVNDAVSTVDCPRQDLLCVARFIPEKNLIRLIDAYSLYRCRYAGDNPLSLNICGSGPIDEDLRRHVNDSGVQGVKFAGFVPQPELYIWFARSKALILPSVSETWGLVINEALVSGLPVLVSNRCGCVPELVQSGETGWLFDPENVEELAHLILKVEQLPEEEFKRIGMNCMHLIANWDLDRFTSGIFKLVDLINNSKH